jgi:tetratricopeptide (TPR) repeat protein
VAHGVGGWHRESENASAATLDENPLVSSGPVLTLLMTSPQVLRVFLSSPGDVGEERKLAREVLEALEGSHLLKGKVRFELVAWDDEHAAAPMDAGETPQASVNRYTGRPRDCDLTLVILWSRIGTRLPSGLARANGTPYESGTVWEYEDALGAKKPVWVYRRTQVPKIDLDDAEIDRKRAQYTAVKAFVAGFENPDGSLRAGFTPYPTPADLAKILRQHLEAFVNERMGADRSAASRIGPEDIQVSQILTLVDELARKNRQLDEREAEIASLKASNEALRRAAVARTLTAAAQPEATAEARAAGAALETGDTRPAEVMLREQEQAVAEPLQAGLPRTAAQRVEAAELAREQGALAIGRDVRVALASYLRASEYEPDDAWTHLTVGDLQAQLGDSNAAMRSYRTGMSIIQRLAASDPSNSQWQRDLSVSHNRIGDTQRAQGDLAEALKSYQAAMAIAQKLAATDPSKSQWQHDRSVSHIKIGDTQGAHGDQAEALKSYQAAMAIAQKLAASDPSNGEWQRDLSVSHDKIGDTQRGQSDLAEALKSYQAAMAIWQKLAASDPSNNEWQRGLSVSQNKIGDTQRARGDLAEALKSYQAGMTIAQKLAASDPSNSEWQRDLSISHDRIGDTQGEHGDLAEALKSYQAGMAIAQKLAASDRSNIEWQTDIAVSAWKIGTLENSPQGRAECKAVLTQGLDVLQSLAQRQLLAPVQADWPDMFRSAIAKLK